MKLKKTTAPLPEAKILKYSLNPETGWYYQTSAPPGFTKVPAELRVEETQRPDVIGAATIIRSRQVGGVYPFFTGLRSTEFSGLFYGDFFTRRPNGAKTNSFVLFYFEEANQRLTIHFFNSYKLYPNRRATFIGHYWRAYNDNKKTPREYPAAAFDLKNETERNNGVPAPKIKII